METERQLLEAIRSGERAAMHRLYDRYSGYAMAVGLRYLPDREEVRDVLQDSFVKILTSIQQFRYQGEGSLKSWVARIVSNRSIDYLREHQRFLLVDSIPDEPDDSVPDGFAVETADTSPEGVPPDVLLAMIGRLPPNYRTVLNLFVYEQRSHREIAQLLGVKESTSSSLFFRARKRLSKMIKEYIDQQTT